MSRLFQQYESIIQYLTMTIAGLSLLLALMGGLRRMGTPFPFVSGHLAYYHGGLMVSGFLGTLIAMERAVSLPIPGSLIVPLLSALGGLFILSNVGPSSGILLIVLASLGLLGFFAYIYSVQPSLHNAVLVLGAATWVGGNLHWWWNVPVHEFVNWWIGFLVFVVAAERLELNRLKQFSLPEKAIFVLGVALMLGGLIGETFAVTESNRGFAPGLLVLALWLFQNDMVRQMLTTPGERGYTGWCLVSGYVWLGLGGLLGLLFPETASGFYYDAYLHSVFLGFVFTMIFGHAFIIIPGVLNVTLGFHRWFYLPLILLEGSLALRVGADLWTSQHGRHLGGLLNGIAIVLFLLMILETGLRHTLASGADTPKH